jgi:hypothetical protein
MHRQSTAKFQQLGFLCVSLALLLLWPARADAQLCRSNVHGDHIATANHFEATGIPCDVAVLFATGYTDSAAALNVTTPGVETFRTDAYEWSYLWTCRTSEIADQGIAYNCAGRDRTGRFGRAHMSFRWWLPNERSCSQRTATRFLEFVEIGVSRNQTCAYAIPWIETATEAIEDFLKPVATKTNGLEYHYYASGGDGGIETNPAGPAGILYDCTDVDGEEGSHGWDCWRPGRPPFTTEFSWKTQPVE